jgi:hypothetical protein
MAKKEKIQIEVEVPSKALEVKHVTCPNGHPLFDEEVKFEGHPSIKTKVKYKDKIGFIYLDPVYGSYNKIEEGIKIPKNAIVEFFCPKCDVSLTDAHDTCHLCASPLFVFHLPKNSIVEGCLKKGCLFHKIKIVDAEQQLSRLFKNDTLESYL